MRAILSHAALLLALPAASSLAAAAWRGHSAARAPARLAALRAFEESPPLWREDDPADGVSEEGSIREEESGGGSVVTDPLEHPNISVRLMEENRLRMLEEARAGIVRRPRRGDRPFDAILSMPAVAAFFTARPDSLKKVELDLGSAGPYIFFALCTFAPWEFMRAYLAERAIVPTLPWLDAWQELIEWQTALFQSGGALAL